MLSSDEIKHFEDYGYLAKSNAFDPQEVIDPIIKEYEGVLDNLANILFKQGTITSTYESLEFGERVTSIYEESKQIHNQFFDFSLPQKGITKDTPFWAGPAVFNALVNPDLLDIVQSIVGTEIASNPVQHVRVKIPENRAPRDSEGNVMYGATPWHQDLGVVTEEADQTDMLTVWFPLMDTDEENGCLQVLPGSHTGEVMTHCPGAQGVQIPGVLLASDTARAIPLKKGDILLLNKKTIHSALPNMSSRIRWSFDLRYQPVGQPTGRNNFPEFVARSRSNPSTELRDATEWAHMWEATRNRLANEEDPSYNRWDPEHILCA
ncbi:MAG: phytanoyl-CoA dioxygenase [Chloroflexi bacterium]|nr:phytanoyl-CoA dioxygenase [Chloroflexota bacterium]